MTWLKATPTVFSPARSDAEASRREEALVEIRLREAANETRDKERGRLREKRIREWAEAARARGEKPKREMFSQYPIGELPAPPKKKAPVERMTWTRTCPRTGLVQIRYLPPMPEQTEEERLFWEREEAVEAAELGFNKRMGIGCRYELLEPGQALYRGGVGRPKGGG